MSMRAVTEIHREEGYADTTYFCTKCGAKIVEVREYPCTITTINWELICTCACGEPLTREIMLVVPDISEWNSVEVKEEVEE